MSDATPAATEAPAVEAKVEDAGPCGKKIQVTVPAGRVRAEVDRAFEAYLAASPSIGRGAGMHEYDGIVRDYSPAAIQKRTTEARRRLRLKAVPTSDCCLAQPERRTKERCCNSIVARLIRRRSPGVCGAQMRVVYP